MMEIVSSANSGDLIFEPKDGAMITLTKEQLCGTLRTDRKSDKGTACDKQSH